jgi:Zn ribbon nucleic-acid-binding protein
MPNCPVCFNKDVDVHYETIKGNHMPIVDCDECGNSSIVGEAEQ